MDEKGRTYGREERKKFVNHPSFYYNIISFSFGFEDIKKHEYFKTVKWDSILSQLPPFVPELASIDDISHFDYDDLHPGYVNKTAVNSFTAKIFLDFMLYSGECLAYNVLM